MPIKRPPPPTSLAHFFHLSIVRALTLTGERASNSAASSGSSEDDAARIIPVFSRFPGRLISNQAPDEQIYIRRVRRTYVARIDKIHPRPRYPTQIGAIQQDREEGEGGVSIQVGGGGGGWHPRAPEPGRRKEGNVSRIYATANVDTSRPVERVILYYARL